VRAVAPPTVLILSAVDREIEPLRRRLGAAPAAFAPRFVVTGVGKVSAALGTAAALRELAPALALQIGCAGAYPRAFLEIGDVVVADGEILGDEGVESPEGFLDLAHLGLPAAFDRGAPVFNRVPTGAPSAAQWEEALRRIGSHFTLRRGRLVTLSTASGTRRRAEEVAAHWDPLAESMEGAAAALACLRHGCPFLEVRGISNQVGERRREEWDVETACEHAAEVAQRLLELEFRTP
jgi:futalosine hydrolase